MWTSELDELLIDFVRNHEMLYNIKSRDYRKTQLKQTMWNEIGAVLKISGSACCKRWAYIRDYYIRRKGKPGTGSSGEAAKKRSDRLSFLDTVPSSQRSTITNIVGDERPEENENTDDTAAAIVDSANLIDESETNVDEVAAHENIVPEKKKKKMSHSEERLRLLKEIDHRKPAPVEKEPDETDLFFNSMAKIVKKLPRYEQIRLRMDISTLVGNAELRCISHDNQGSIHSPASHVAETSTHVPENAPQMKSSNI